MASLKNGHRRKHPKGFYLALISIHGLMRGERLELGRDADTGGQTLYVVELARALGERPEVGRVDLITRLVRDEAVDPEYAEPMEELGPKTRLVRIECGPDGYIPKEGLWDHLDAFSDNLIAFFNEQGEQPALIHSHYADASYVGVRVANHLGLPLVHTGHSLGRDKRRRLRAAGVTLEEIEGRYNMSRRIEAEENCLANASLVITSTDQEIEDQYRRYSFYNADSMTVIPPGTDLIRFHPPTGGERNSRINREINRFLADPDKPMILALSRPDARKNIPSLIRAFGESEALQEMANLVIIAGTRTDIRDLDQGAQEVWTDLLILIDRYNLYNKVAYPKSMAGDDVSLLYRLAASSRGVFVNPALVEPFGLTLIEATASGLPIVATEDGGPRDIIANCRNGFLVNPLDEKAIAEKLIAILGDGAQWAAFVGNGIQGVSQHYSWQAHAETYIKKITPLITQTRAERELPHAKPVLHRDRAVVLELDRFLGEEAPEALAHFKDLFWKNRMRAAFVVVTGRGLEAALKLTTRLNLPRPDVIIAAMGTEIYYGRQLESDSVWSRHIDHGWNRKALHRVLRDIPGVTAQEQEEQHQFKISYYLDSESAPSPEEIHFLLRQEEQSVGLAFSHGQYLDLTPSRASKGFALRWIARVWDIPLERILVAAGTGSDEDMLRGNTLGAIIPNPYMSELEDLAETGGVFTAQKESWEGLLEAIEYYDLFGEPRDPGIIHQPAADEPAGAEDAAKTSSTAAAGPEAADGPDGPKD